MSEDAPYAVWEATLAAIAGAEGTVFLLGGMDVGKTTFTRLLVNRLTEAGRSVAVLDADVGQSEIGPPTCAGLAIAEKPVLALSDLPPKALAFVGSTSPQGHLLEHVAAVRRLADMATPHRLIVDTSGYLHGAGARRLNQTEVELLLPAHLVALQRTDELEAILAPIRRRTDMVLHLPALPDVLSKKPTTFRKQRRAMRFASYFSEAKQHVYSFDSVGFVGTWMGGGTPVAAHILKFLNLTLGPERKVYYAETHGRELGLMLSQPIAPHASGMGLVLQHLKAESVAVTVAPRLKHLLVGLESGNGKLLGLGLLESLDFRRRTLGVLTPVRAPDAAQILRFGSLRVQPDGTELGSLKPGEL